MIVKDWFEDIKERFAKYQTDYNLNGEDVEWLITRVERLEEVIGDLNENVAAFETLWLEEKRKNQRYKQALEFYANQCHMNYSIDTGEWDGDDGGIARQTLGWEEGK